MPFVGIIAKENDCNFIKKIILNNSTESKFEIIYINKKCIENIKNIKFDIIVINEDIEKMLLNSKYLEDIIFKANYVVINSDIKHKWQYINNFNTNIITYGFNGKATITISSIREETVLICLQRKIEKIDKKLLDEQEFSIDVNKKYINKLYTILIIFSILGIYGIILKKI